MRKTIPVNPALVTPGAKTAPALTPLSDSAVPATSADIPAQSPAATGADHAGKAKLTPSALVPDSDDVGGARVPGESIAQSGTSMPAANTPQEILDVEIKDKKQLQGIYMPFLTNGGLFLPTTKAYALGDEVSVTLHLLKEPRQYAAIGRVAWITPRNALNKRIQGIGIHFSLDENTGITKRKIEELLGAAVKSDKSTHTL